MWRVGVDVGGTFTDLFAWNTSDGKRITSKVLTTPHDRTAGVLQAIKAAEIDFDSISQILHGTTTATNSLIERSFPDAAMVTTEGFRDVIEIGRMHRQHLYRPYQTKPSPIIKRRHRFTVRERITAAGEIYRELDEDRAREIAREIARRGIKSIAVCFLNSYVNAEHENTIRNLLLEEMPDAFVVVSGDTPVFREHGRFTTTAVRAVLMPVMAEYLDSMTDKLRQYGFGGSLSILKSNGGLMDVETAREHPEEMIESGPAGGVAYAAYLARETNFRNILHTDVGGTSFDVSMVEDGRGLVTREYELEWDVPIVVPMLDIHSVGAGGGSIAWVDDGDSLRVGPKSAGSDPGPACYGRGGTEPTITDANLILNRLAPALGDKFSLDRQAAERAVSEIAERMGMSILEAAEGIVEIGCETMAQAVKMVINRRGRDPRDFVLASFGGAGPMHACFVAQSLSIPKVIVPAYAGIASAFGATAMDSRRDLEKFFHSPLDSIDLEQVNSIFEDLECQGRELLSVGVAESDVQFIRTAQMRYVGQTYEVPTPMPVGEIKKEQVQSIADEFNRCHEIEFGVSSDEFDPEIVSLGIAAIGQTTPPPSLQLDVGGDLRPKEVREVVFRNTNHKTDVWNGELLPAEAEISGPAIVEYAHSCAVLPPGSSASVEKSGNLIISVGLHQQENTE